MEDMWNLINQDDRVENCVASTPYFKMKGLHFLLFFITGLKYVSVKIGKQSYI